MTNYSRPAGFPRTYRAYLWFVDIGIATNGSIRCSRAIRARRRTSLAGPVSASQTSAPISERTPRRESLRVLRRANSTDASRAALSATEPDGSLIAALDSEPAPSRRGRSGARRATRGRRQSGRIRRTSARSIQRRYVYFERTLAFMNRHDATPVIVLNPFIPKSSRAAQYGYPGRQARRSVSARPACAVRLRRRGRRGHPIRGLRGRDRLLERQSRQPPEHAASPDLHRRALHGARVSHALHDLRLLRFTCRSSLVGWWGIGNQKCSSPVSSPARRGSSTPGGTGASCR